MQHGDVTGPAGAPPSPARTGAADDAATHRPVALAMRDITKTFPGVRALSDVSLTVYAGQVHALLGENGAGKSTLMNILAGVFTDYGGSIEVGGTPASIHHPRDAARLGIAMIHQELNLVPDLSISDNIFLGRELRTRAGTIDRARMHRRTRELLGRLGLTLDPRRLVRNCRVAEQQLIEVAKALSLDVRVLVMDEPTSALADAEVRRLFGVIRALASDGVAVIYISHRLEELDEIAEAVTVLRDGRYIGTRTVADTNRDELIRMMVGRPVGQLFPRADAQAEVEDELLRVEGLSLVGDARTGRAALHDINLRVSAGEIVGLAGLMGSGRSETLEAIYGVHGAYHVTGRITLAGRPYRPTSPGKAIRRGLALVAEDRKAQSLVLHNTVRFNISLPSIGRYRRGGLLSSRRERLAVADVARQVRVKTPSMSAVVNNLSGGNQQKVVLAKWLITRPRVILMDEPTRGIDVGAKAEIYALMSRLAERGSAIVMVSSELPELLAMCDRIIVLCEGRVTGEFARGQASQEEILAAAMARQLVLAAPDGDPSPTAEHSEGLPSR